MNSQQYIAIPTSGLSIAVEKELLIPDPPDFARGVEIIQNGTKCGTTGHNPKSN
jgi:hypothetical protein